MLPGTRADQGGHGANVPVAVMVYVEGGDPIDWPALVRRYFGAPTPKRTTQGDHSG